MSDKIKEAKKQFEQASQAHDTDNSIYPLRELARGLIYLCDHILEQEKKSK